MAHSVDHIACRYIVWCFVFSSRDMRESLQSCPTLCDPMECSPPGSSVHGILQARILEWDALPASKGSSQPRDRTHIPYMSCISRWVLYHLGQMSKHGLHSFRFHIRNFPTNSCEVLELYSHLHLEKLNLFYGRQILLFEWGGCKCELLQRM